MGIPEDIARLELELRELIIKYEQYFFGIEKREPLKLLDNVQRLAARYRNISIANTMQRFKYDSLVSSLCVHSQKWNRINRLIEDGKYDRERFKLSLRQGNKSSTPPTPASPAPASPDSESELIFQQYLAARKSCNLPVENVSREAIASAIARQKPAIMEKYRCSDVEFVVVVENGKPSLKARPKSS